MSRLVNCHHILMHGDGHLQEIVARFDPVGK